MTRAQTTATTQQNTGGALPPAVAGKNAVINGAFDIWQRGTSIAIPATTTTYTADRWYMYRATANVTISRQTTGDTTNLPFIQYCARIQRNNANTSTDSTQLNMAVESVNAIPFAGKTVTLSFYARKGANYSSASDALSVLLATGTGTDQLVGGYTGYNALISQTATLTTTWQRFSYTATIPSTITEWGLGFTYTPVGTAGASDYFEITGVQVEAGAVATPFSRYSPTIQGELAACQRYYWRSSSMQAYSVYAVGPAQNTTNATILVTTPTTMRIAPSSIDYSTLCVQAYGGQSTYAVTSLILSTSTQTGNTFAAYITVASGLTAGTWYLLLNNNNSAGYIGVSAEL